MSLTKMGNFTAKVSGDSLEMFSQEGSLEGKLCAAGRLVSARGHGFSA